MKGRNKYTADINCESVPKQKHLCTNLYKIFQIITKKEPFSQNTINHKIIMSKRGLPRRFKHSSNRTNLHQSASVHYTKRPNVAKRANFLNSDVLEINEELDFRMLVCLPDGEDISRF